jgi:ABC-type sugar transport system permease subunit
MLNRITTPSGPAVLRAAGPERAERTAPRAISRRRRALLDSTGQVAFVAPAFIMVTLFVLIPIGIAFYLSLTDWNGFSPNPAFVGSANYERILEDDAALRAGTFTAILAICGTLGCNVAGLGFALLLTRSTRFNSFMRALLFYPYVVGALMIGFIWSAILGANGVVNSALESAGLDKIPFLSDPTLSGLSVIAVTIWAAFGVNLVLYLAGLQTIDESMLEAARIDGASTSQIFWQVKLPLLAPVVTVNIVLSAVALLKTYDLVLSLTSGGPAGRTETVAYQILAVSFSNGSLGYGAAQSVVLMVVVVAVTIAITSFRNRAERNVAA